ncbi:hypothetical protein P9E34_19745 [Schinkia azotoformans]|uniref:hypothetical protein n=1 Tax=Schinkia azotoformans TaxID=1454 RepID=UPI002DB5CB56|nr:hypothetical protein [Schinkia azotoformans]MEC1726945.1 hypothetical protein [Schinkia azotoformans]
MKDNIINFQEIKELKEAQTDYDKMFKIIINDNINWIFDNLLQCNNLKEFELRVIALTNYILGEYIRYSQFEYDHLITMIRDGQIQPIVDYISQVIRKQNMIIPLEKRLIRKAEEEFNNNNLHT